MVGIFSIYYYIGVRQSGREAFAPWVTSDGEMLQGSVGGLEDTGYVVLTMKSEASHVQTSEEHL